MDSQRWQAERQPGEAGRGGSHSPYVRDTKVSRGPDASLVAYQDSQTHAARQHWGPSKPFDQPAKSYQEQPTRQTSSRTPYANAGYGSGGDSHYTTTPTAAYGSSHPGYQAAPASAAPRTQPADPYSSAYQQQPTGREYASQSSAYAYPAQSQTDPYSRSAAPPTSQYGATPRYFGYFDEQYLVYR
jgi:hypothetical protein